MNQAGWSGPIKDFVEEDRIIVRKAYTRNDEAKLVVYVPEDPGPSDSTNSED